MLRTCCTVLQHVALGHVALGCKEEVEAGGDNVVAPAVAQRRRLAGYRKDLAATWPAARVRSRAARAVGGPRTAPHRWTVQHGRASGASAAREAPLCRGTAQARARVHPPSASPRCSCPALGARAAHAPARVNTPPPSGVRAFSSCAQRAHACAAPARRLRGCASRAARRPCATERTSEVSTPEVPWSPAAAVGRGGLFTAMCEVQA